jgi:hypothetical protein
MSFRPEADTRSFWVFTATCGHVIGVLTDENYDYHGAYWEMYGDIQAASDAMDRTSVDLVNAETYHASVFEKVQEGCTCPK